ncbi:UNVERIFIED_CONTAM: hypothetical protein GTU68_008869 [Idotea baltica]|nr:hypothetical protein [Idotea baltica]
MTGKLVKIGIIGGSGLNNPDLFTDSQKVIVNTKFGSPSDPQLLEGKIDGVPCVLLARHGRNHSIFPSAVNYRANLLALKNLGCSHVIVSTACGSLREEIAPGNFVVIDDQFIDRTQNVIARSYDGSCGDFKDSSHPDGQPFLFQSQTNHHRLC